MENQGAKVTGNHGRLTTTPRNSKREFKDAPIKAIKT
jgi:hypothetical protein